MPKSDREFWDEVRAKLRRRDPMRPVTESPYLFDDDHPAALLMPTPTFSQEMVGELLAKLGIKDIEAYGQMTPEERRQYHQERIDKWMRGEELD